MAEIPSDEEDNNEIIENEEEEDKDKTESDSDEEYPQEQYPEDEEMIENQEQGAEEITESDSEESEEEEEDPEDEEMTEIQEQGAEEIIEMEAQGEVVEQQTPTQSRTFTEEYWESKLKLVKIREEDMNKLVMNFLVAQGLVEVAEKFQNESGTKRILLVEALVHVLCSYCYLFDQETAEVEFASIKERMDIVKDIQSGNLDEAIEKLNALYPEIPKKNFILNQQRLIEIIRLGTKEEALEFAEKELKPIAEQNEKYLKDLKPFAAQYGWYLKEYEKTLTLLHNKDDPTCAMRELLTNSQWLKTAQDVSAAIHTSQTGEKYPKIQYLIHMLEWSQLQLSNDSAEYPKMDVSPE